MNVVTQLKILYAKIFPKIIIYKIVVLIKRTKIRTANIFHCLLFLDTLKISNKLILIKYILFENFWFLRLFEWENTLRRTSIFLTKRVFKYLKAKNEDLAWKTWKRREIEFVSRRSVVLENHSTDFRERFLFSTQSSYPKAKKRTCFES